MAELKASGDFIVEFTYDRTYMEKIGFSRRSFEEILRDAEKQFETLDKETQPVEVRAMIPTRETTKKLNSITHSMKYVKMLEALSCKSNELIKSESIQLATNLTRSMVHYRLSQKLNWLLEKVGRKWKLKKGALQVISHFLKLIGEIEYLLDYMGKTIVRTFGIGGIKSVDKQEIGVLRIFFLLTPFLFMSHIYSKIFSVSRKAREFVAHIPKNY
jgi:hypothetical protein